LEKIKLPINEMKEIQLTKGQVAFIDDEDFEKVSLYKWTASYTNGKYYARRGVCVNGKQKTIYLHRFLTSAEKAIKIDHKNGNSLDNRKSNLRKATSSQNNQNRGNTAGKKYKGVGFYPQQTKPFRARIKHSGKVIFIGNYATEIEAAKAYDQKALELFGSFARPNFQAKG